MKITITNETTGEKIPLSRDVCTPHPAWVHEQCETSSEGDLQHMLDQYCIQNYYDSDGESQGPDICGINMEFDDSQEAKEYGITLAK